MLSTGMRVRCHHGDGIVKVDGDFDLVGVSGERFVTELSTTS